MYETPTLRALHEQLNRELQEVVLDPSAPHDDALADQAAGSKPKCIECFESGHMLPNEALQAWRNGSGRKSALM